MTCEQFEIALPAYLAGTLADQDARTLEEHAASCAVCEQHLEAATRLDQQLVAHLASAREGTHADPASSTALPAELRAATLAAVARRRQQQRSARWWRPVLAIAAVALTAVAIQQYVAIREATSNGATPVASTDTPLTNPDRFAADRSSTEFTALDAAARELEAALAHAPDDAELRAFLATVQARRDELTRRVKAAKS